ncbi:hypothetical protein BKA64DRAFT_634661 [Cadophora sp. MPI-SDFR-AT-0126]|nr:hypothetical protein BKA64DRAFT_634661 [Leotiomycetes sp. MPI-SDFR-AT-0126]
MASNWPTSWPPPAAELHVFDVEGDVLFILTRSTLKNETAKEDDIELGNTELTISSYADMIIPEPVEHMEVDINTELPGYIRATEDDRIRSPSTSRLHVVTDLRLSFAECFGPDFQEGTSLRTAQSVAIPLLDDDPDAMVILLNIIYGRTRQVPRKIDFESDLPSELAKLIDYYQLHEVTELFSDTWLRDSTRGENLQNKYWHSSALRWLWISWVFQDASLFKSMTQLMMLKGEDDPEYVADGHPSESDLRQEYAEGLPIPPVVLDAIRAHRSAAITKAIDAIYKLIDDYSGDDIQCSSSTNPKGVLGCLVRGARQANIWPRPKQSLYDFSFEALATPIRNIYIDTLCAQTCVTDILDTHDVDRSLSDSMVNIKKSLCGLDINDFIPEQRRRDLQ